MYEYERFEVIYPQRLEHIGLGASYSRDNNIMREPYREETDIETRHVLTFNLDLTQRAQIDSIVYINQAFIQIARLCNVYLRALPVQGQCMQVQMAGNSHPMRHWKALH